MRLSQVRPVATLAFSAGLILASTCCAPKDAPGAFYNVYLDPALGDKTADILDALRDWETSTAKTPTPVVLVPWSGDLTCVDGTAPCEHTITIHWAPEDGLGEVAGGTELGVTHRNWSVRPLEGEHEWSNIYLDQNLPEHEWRTVIRHELGHALALAHTGPDTIMCAYTTCGSENITCKDVQQYAELRGESAVCP